MKACFKCGDTKPLTDFYSHPMMADGYLGKCKECAKRDVRRHRQENRAKVNAYDRARFAASPERQADKLIRDARYNAVHPLRRRATLKVYRAVKNGVLVRQPCEACGATKVVAHHDDYSKPLDVRWLCSSCHVRHHRGTLQPF